MAFFSNFFSEWAAIWALISNTWWLWAPFVLFFLAKTLWALYLKIRYFTYLQWVLLEVKLPRDISKSPQAMEQVFAGLQAMFWEFDPQEIWWEGLQHDFIVFEMASTGGDTHFYIRVPVFFRNLVEAQIYSQYPEAEILEAEDYMKNLPETVPTKEWDLFGLEFKLVKEDAYPIRTYIEFPTIESMKEEERKVDPFSSIAELFGKIKPGEHIGYHLLIRPVQSDKWRKDGEKLVNKLIGKKDVPEKGAIAKALEPLEPMTKGWGEPLKPLFGMTPSEGEPPKKREDTPGSTLMQHLSPGTKDIVAAIEKNIMKPGFESVIRFCYVARRDVFSLSHLASFIGGLKNYNTQTLNAFKLNSGAMATSVHWWWLPFMKKKRKNYKKWLFYNYYRARKPFTDTQYLRSAKVVLNTEELATIYHYPGSTAKAPMMQRIESKRSSPPAELPVG